MAFKVLVCLLSYSLASVCAGLLPNIDFHYQHNQPSISDENPLQKLSAGYEAPGRQYQQNESEQRQNQQHQQHFEYIQHASTPPTAQQHIESHSDAVYLAPEVHRQLHSAQQQKNPTYTAENVAVEFTSAVVSAPLKTTVYLKPRTRQHVTVQYQIQPSQRLIAFDTPAVYEPHQNRADSHLDRGSHAIKYQQRQQHDIVAPLKNLHSDAVFHPIYFHAVEEEPRGSTVTPAAASVVRPHPVYVQHQQSNNVAPVYAHRQTNHYNTVAASKTKIPNPVDHYQHQPLTVYLAQPDDNVTVAPQHYAQRQLQLKQLSPPQRGLIAPTVSVDQHNHRLHRPQQQQSIQPQYLVSHQQVGAVQKSVNYSPAEAVSHQSFKSASAQYSW